MSTIEAAVEDTVLTCRRVRVMRMGLTGPVAARRFDLPAFAADGRRYDNPRRVPVYDHDGHLLGTARRVRSSDTDRYLAPCRLDDRAAFGRWDQDGRLWFVKLSTPTR